MRGSTPTTLLIDATMIPEDRGGVGRFIEAVVPVLSERADLDVGVLCQARDASWFRSTTTDMVIVAPSACVYPLFRLLWEQLALPRAARRVGADVILSPHYTFPLITRLPRLVVVHDLTFFTLPSLHKTIKRFFFRAWIRLARRSRVGVVVPSQATADELSRIVGIPSSRVVVAALAVDPAIFHPPTKRELERFISSQDGLDDGWIAFLGTLEPRKNVPALIDAYEQSAATQKQPPVLLLAGGAGWDHHVTEAIHRATSRGVDVRWLGYLPIDELSAFLGAAELVVYPSLGEGFGLPVLEAMAAGACVLTTRELSLPEVGGDAVAYSGTSSEELAEALGSLLGDRERQKALRSAALERAGQFTWAHTAEVIAAAAKDVAKGRS